MSKRRFDLRGLAAGLALVLPLALVVPIINAFQPTAAFAQDQDQKPPFFDELSPYGVWIDSPKYGAVWQPADVDGTFRPYEGGHWVLTADWGWYFEASQPWGDIVFHYGRWAFDDTDGWVWVPATEWAPAWVSWRHGHNSVGWAPIGPKDQDETDSAYWSFADDSNFASATVVDLYTVVYARDRVHEVFGDTQFLGHPQANRPIDIILDPHVLERESHLTIRTESVDYRVALDGSGHPIGWNPNIFGANAHFKFEAVRARADAQPTPAVTERLLYDIRSGRVRDSDRFADAQVTNYARHGDFHFADAKQEALVKQIGQGGKAPANAGELFKAVRTDPVTVAGKPLPQPQPHGQVARFKTPDDATAHPDSVGIPPKERVFAAPPAAKAAAGPASAQGQPAPLAAESPKPGQPQAHSGEAAPEQAKPPTSGETPRPTTPAGETRPQRAPEPQKAEPPKPETHEPPKPEAHEPPKPEVREAPKPEVREAPKPEVREAPKPEAHEAPKPEVREAPKPEVREPPKPEAHETPKPEAAKPHCEDPKHCEK
jgi:hypothetical protein